MTITSTPPPSARRLPVLETARQTVETALAHRGQVVPVAVWPVSIIVLATILGFLFAASVFANLLLNVVITAAYTLFAVAWHRLVLLDSPHEPSSPGAWQPRHSIFFLYLIAVYLVLLPANMAINLSLAWLLQSAEDPTASPTGIESWIPIAALIAIFLIVYVGFRLSFVFPARAVDEQYGLRDSRRHTAGNGFRLIAIAVVVLLPTAIALGLLLGIVTLLMFGTQQAPSVGPLQLLGFVVLGLAYAAAQIVVLVLSVTMVSVAFRKATGWVPPPAPSVPPAPQSA